MNVVVDVAETHINILASGETRGIPSGEALSALPMVTQVKEARARLVSRATGKVCSGSGKYLEKLPPGCHVGDNASGFA
jgi:hypothetical protein